MIESGQGVYLYDTDGRRYLDAIGSWWVSILGHSHPRITAAVKKQLDMLEHVLMAGFVSKPALDHPRRELFKVLRAGKRKPEMIKGVF